MMWLDFKLTLLKPGNTKGGKITVPLTCFIGLESEGAILGFFVNRSEIFHLRNYVLLNLNISFTYHLISGL